MNDRSRPKAAPEPTTTTTETSVPTRSVRFTPMSEVTIRPVRWCWQDRVPLGEITITAGAGGIGKSTFLTWLVAGITTGTLSGAFNGTPKPCAIATSEDSYSHTVAPRLVAAGAALELVYRVDVVTDQDEETALSLPADLRRVEVEVARTGTVLLVVDPLMSVIHASLDTHKDRDVRQALEPLRGLAERTGCAIVGNAHFNRRATSDPMDRLMGSAAFGNTVRALLAFAKDEDGEEESGAVVISQAKSNLGRLDLPSLRYVIESATVPTVEDEPARVGRLVFVGESKRTVHEILADRWEDPGDTRAVDAWLRHLLSTGPVESAEVFRAAHHAGFSRDQAKRSKKRLGIEAIHPDIRGPWFWRLPTADESANPPREHQEAQGSTSRDTAPLHSLGAPLDASSPEPISVDEAEANLRAVFGDDLEDLWST
jgi:AAA domain